MGPKQTHSLFHSKGNKKQHTEWKKISANDATDKCLISKNIQTAHTTQQQKTDQSKNGKKI